MKFSHYHTGPLFRDFIAQVIRKKQARGYLEVGVRDGATLVLADCPSIGVDPDFQLSLNPMGSKTALHLYQMTSDQFFRDHDPRLILGAPVDVVFLDGLHQFEYLLRDFINSEAVSRKEGLIMLDDCLPVNSEMTERYHAPDAREDKDLAQWWTGDVWKLLPILQTFRPDLRICPIDTQPTGNICITNLDPTSTILRERYYEIVDRYRDLTMNDSLLEQFYKDYPVQPASKILHGFDASMWIGP